MDQLELSQVGSSRLDDEHYLFIRTGIAHDYQLIKALKDTFIKYKINTSFKVSLVSLKGKYVGHAYVWVESKKAFHLLTGTGQNNGNRTKKILDPNWHKPIQLYEEALKEIDEDFPDSDDYTDQIMRETAIAKLQEEYRQPQIEVPDNPVIELENYQHTPEQLRYHRAQAIKDGSNPDDVPKYGSFIISPARIPTDKTNLQQHVLYCQYVPSWVSEEDLKNIFKLYASDTSTIHCRKVNGIFKSDTYPFVVIIERDTRRIAYVTFDENTIDGRMTAYVCRKVTVIEDILKIPSGRNEPRTSILVFNHPVNSHN